MAEFCNVTPLNNTYLKGSPGKDSLIEIMKGFITSKLEDFRRWSFTAHENDNDFKRAVFDSGLLAKEVPHCNLRRKLVRWLEQGEPLRIALIGGSASAMPCPASECPPGFTFIQRAIQQLNALAATARKYSEGGALAPGPASARNLAQGATDTLFNSFVIESILDASSYDVLIWEFAINDLRSAAGLGQISYNASKGQAFQGLSAMLDIWLRRISAATAGLAQKPAIVLLYLWDWQGGHGEAVFPQHTAWRMQLHVAEYYRSRGMDISVLNAGAAIFGPDAATVLKDPVHPNCAGNQYLADVLTFHLVSEALQELGGPRDSLEPCADNVRDAPLPPLQGWGQGGAEFQLSAMLHASRIRALTLWRPQDSVKSLGVRAAGSVNVSAMLGAKHADGRSDMKLAFNLPKCGGRAPPLVIHVANPGPVFALVLGFAGMHLYFQRPGLALDLRTVRVHVGDVEVRPMALGPAFDRIQFLRQWAGFWVPINQERGGVTFVDGLVKLCAVQGNNDSRQVSATAVTQLNFLAVLDGPFDRPKGLVLASDGPGS